MNVSVIMLILGYSYFSGGLGGPNVFFWGSFIDALQGRREKSESAELCVPTPPTSSRQLQVILSWDTDLWELRDTMLMLRLCGISEPFASPLVSLALPTFVKCMCCSDELWKVPFLDPLEVLPKGYRSIHYMPSPQISLLM